VHGKRIRTYELRKRGGGYGVAAICIGVGPSLAVVLEAEQREVDRARGSTLTSGRPHRTIV
jgi:hypothetical protein